MDVQSAATASLLLPTALLGWLAWRARRGGRTDFGLRLRDGGVVDLAVGSAWGVGVFVVLVGLPVVVGVVRLDGTTGQWLPSVGIAVFFALLFWLEEVAFRGVLLTGLGVVWGVLPAVLVSSVLVALPYSLSDSTSVLAVVGAVVANLMNGVARWRTGRIWFGLGLRWVLNSLVVAVGLPNAAFRLDDPVLRAEVGTPAWLTGGAFGLEGGLLGILVEVAVIAVLWRFAVGRRGPWTVHPHERQAEQIRQS